MDRFSSYLPSKTFSSIVVSLVIVAFLIVGALNWSKPKENALAVSLKQPYTVPNSNVIADQDTDNDGLKDWEEVLWQTNPYEKDTDKDGTTDGDEVKVGRNPRVAGPNDKGAGAFASGSLPEVLSATDRLAHDLFSRYASVKRSGGVLDKATEEQIISAVLSNTKEVTVRTYTASDLSIIKASDDTALRTYGNAMGTIVKKYSIKNENELVIFERAVRNDNPEELKNLDPILAAYEGMLREMISVSVPQNAVSIHVALLNSMSGIFSTIQAMRVIYSDPSTALLSVSEYVNYSKKQGETLKGVSDLFGNKNVAFAENENGFYFANLAY